MGCSLGDVFENDGELENLVFGRGVYWEDWMRLVDGYFSPITVSTSQTYIFSEKSL